MTNWNAPAILRATMIASMSCLLSLASCDLAGDEGGPGPSEGITGQLAPPPQTAPPTLNSVRATIGAAELQADQYSQYPSVSGDGRYVVFSSNATNLVNADLNGTSDIFLRDTATNQTKIISVSTSGLRGDNQSYEPYITPNGRFIVFTSYATNLDETTPDTNNQSDIYLHDRDPDGDGTFFDEDANDDDPPTTERVSYINGGTNQSSGQAWRASISNDGNVVAFISYSTDLVAGDTNGYEDAFVRIRNTSTTRRVSVEAPPNISFPNGPDGIADGSNLNYFSFIASISGNGLYVAYMTYASDAVYNDTNGYYDIYRVHVNTLATDRVSLGVGAVQPNNYCYTNYFQGGGPSISDDGMRVSFSSSANNIVANDTNNQYDVFVRDFAGGGVQRVLGPGGAQANGFTFDGRFTGDGTRLVFISSASNFGPDFNSIQDVFVKNLLSGATTLVSVHTNGTPSNDYVEMGVVSSDGTAVVFGTYANNLVDDDTNFTNDIFKRDLTTLETTRVSLPNGANEANGSSDNSRIAGSSAVVVFHSDAYNLVDNDSQFGFRDVFVRDVVSQTMKMVSVNIGGNPANGTSAFPSCSSDGRFIAFESSADDLVQDDFNGNWDVFVRDMAAGVTYRISKDPAGNDANGASFSASISADGRYVSFQSSADNLVTDDLNALTDVFVYDRQTGTTTRVSVDSAGVEANADSFFSAISGDGRFVTFLSLADNLVANDTNALYDVFLHDRQTGATTRVSVDSAGLESDGDSWNPCLSSDGRYIAFESGAANLVAGDTNLVWDIFVHDRQTGTTVRVSVNSAGGEVTGGDSVQPSISADGRFVAFTSGATDLIVGDANATTDVFVHDRDPNGNGFDGTDGNTIRASVDPTGLEADGPSDSPSISLDGRWVSFSSAATNLAVPDIAGNIDIFLRGPLF